MRTVRVSGRRWKVRIVGGSGYLKELRIIGRSNWKILDIGIDCIDVCNDIHVCMRDNCDGVVTTVWIIWTCYVCL